MARRRHGRPVHGVFLLDKPAGISSNRALQQVRRLYDAQKAGHTGTLDPFATGLLPICLGEATKTAGYMLQSSKTYRADCRLGIATQTGDTEGEVVEQADCPDLTAAQIQQVLRRFTGRIQQCPPMHSAIRHQGRRLYELARQGIEVAREPRTVEITRLQLIDWSQPQVSFRVECSKGTYVRTLAEDLAKALGTCGHLTALRRESISAFTQPQMHSLDELQEAAQAGRAEEWLLPVDSALQAWPLIRLEAEQLARFRHGGQVPVKQAEGRVRVYDGEGHVVGLGEVASSGMLRPLRVFVDG